VTGTAWKLFLDPGIGLEKAVRDLGWTSFSFNWVVNPRMMIYCVAIAGIWASSGFVMALFLAGLRGIDSEILKAAQIDGASGFAMYRRIIIPIMRPVFFSALIILTHLAIKSYDLVLSVTGKNPGGAAELPSTFMYSYTFTRNQMAVGSASAVIMLMAIAAIMVPLSLFRVEGQGPMSAADALLAVKPQRDPSRSSMTTRIVIYGLLGFFAIVYLLPLVVMVMTSLKPLDEVTGGNMFALPPRAELRRLGEGVGHDMCRAHLRGHQGLFLELDQDGDSRRPDLDAAGRAERLRVDRNGALPAIGWCSA